MSLVRLEDLNKERRRLNLRKTLENINHIYMVMSGKGGVGKTTVAVNLAMAKAAAGFKVGLLDIDFHGPSVAGALNAKSSLKVDGQGRLIPLEGVFGLKIISIQGLLKRPEEAVIWRGPKKMMAIKQFMSEVVWGQLDYLFIDSPPGTGDEPLTMIKTAPGLKPLMVTTGHRLAIDDVAKAFDFLKTARCRAFGLIENQSFLICPHCGQETDLCNRQAARQLAEREVVPFLASLPLSIDATKATEEGQAIVATDPENNFSKAISALADFL